MKTFKYLLVLLLFVLVNQQVFGAIERFSNRLDGDNGLTSSSNLEVYDDKYFDMVNDPFWSVRFANKKASGLVRIGINPDMNITSTSDWACVVNFTVFYDKWNSTTNSFQQFSMNQSMTIIYNMDRSAEVLDQSSLIIDDAQYIKVRLTSVTAYTIGGTTYPLMPISNLFLETDIDVERYYTLDNTSVSNLTHTELDIPGATANGPQIEFRWNTKLGAEFYELEWVHINEYIKNSTGGLNPSVLNYNFYLNSTRIETKQNWYRIPRIFDRGYIVYRVRPIGRNGTNFTDRQEGVWTVLNESGTVSSFSLANTIHIQNEYSKLNWSQSVVYMEDGKRVEGISYADGLGRVHQSIGYNPVNNQASVSNIYYDELGRPAVSDLPTPNPGAALNYQKNFNLVDGTTDPYSWHNFDTPLLDSCDLNSTAFSTTKGTGKYYTPYNTDQNGVNVAIPDAEKYPFSRVVFVKDFSNRVALISAAGEDLKIGSGKETQIFYPSTNQWELNQLFGTEVGFASHYVKMITVDPNGQVYVQYTDMAGRVVASYMEGPSPTNVDGVEGNSSTPLIVTMIDNGNPQTVDHTVPYSEITYSQYISSDTVFNFNYSFTPQQFQSACTGNLCLDCIYDLEIEVIDNCGQLVTLNGYTNPVHIIGSDIDDLINGTCNSDQNTVHQETFSASLTQGMYKINKKLTVNEQAVDDYWCLYLEANTCIESVASIFNELYTQEPFAACDPIIEEDVEDAGDECGIAKDLMLMDVSPGGQYGKYTVSPLGAYSSSDLYSVFNESGQLGNWRTLTYLDANNAVVTFASGAQGLKDFITNFRPEWAEQLVARHPEKCYLDFCVSNSASQQYDNEMNAVNAYVTADLDGFLMPVQFGTPNVGFNYFPSSFSNSYYDPFFTSTGVGASRADEMLLVLNNYATVMGTSFSMWEYALYLAAGGQCRKVEELPDCMSLNDCNRDLVWLTFRELYQQEKATQIYYAQQEYAAAHGCSNQCIGASSTTQVSACNLSPQNQLATRTPRFGNLNQFANSSLNPTTEAEAQAETDAVVLSNCNSSCDSYVEQWLTDLAGCPEIASIINNGGQVLIDLKADLKAVCMAGCDTYHPLGATTTPPGETANGYTSVQEVLAQYLSGTSSSSNQNCSFYLITAPGPYKPTSSYLDELPVMDQCGCDILMDVRTNYLAALANSSIPSSMSIEQFLAISKGILLDDADNLLCVCDQFYDEANNQWSVNANSDIIAAKKIVPEALTCEVTDDCKTCTEINTKYAEAYAYANATLGMDAATFEGSSNYEVILTNYLNTQLGYDLTFTDYDFFHKGCLATSLNPVCEMNPIMSEFEKMVSLLAMRGQLIHTSPLNLVTENIVYKHGKLNEDNILGGTYSSTTSAGSLTMSFQEGSETPCTFNFTVAGNSSFDFSKVISFGDVWPNSTNCGLNGAFEIELKYYDCGILKTILAQVSTSCLQVNFCYCGDNGQRLCDEPLFDPNFEICYQPTLDELMQNAFAQYDASITAAYNLFNENYKTQCAAAFSTEHFDLQGKFRYYQYTLFYYDQAGNLVRTVAPKGVVKMAANQNNAINTSRIAIGTPLVPAQEYETKYNYNSYNQLVSTTNPDQEGKTEFWYDFYGRVVLSQNPVQYPSKYSYIFYDNQGRPEEAGQVVPATSLTTIDLKVPDASSTAFRAWVNASGSARSEVTKTFYDEVFITSTSLQNKFTLQPGQFTPGQQNLRLRVASVIYYKTVTGTITNTTAYASAVHYTYDLHGNVLQTLQDVPELALVKQDIKSTEYEFELISGNVKAVKYQKDKLDQLTHTYFYDKLNRLEEAFVTTDKIHKSRQAHYLYYDYGPLARVELGEQKVQGMDYAYTINGWMKAMNGTILNPGYELGRDNASGYLSQNTSVHSKFAKDVVGYTLGYFNGDYQSIGSTNFAPSPYVEPALNSAISPLYNGNIAYTSTAISDNIASGPTMAIQMGVYRYDQMNRLVSARTFRASGLAASNSWTGATETQEYKSTYSYDPNGNLKTLLRNGGPTNVNMDNFTYQPETMPITGAKTNRLDYVDDTPGYSGYYTEDIDDQALNNYVYDKLGQLTSDASDGGMTIEWFTGNRKVKKIIRPSKTIEFTYNPFGQRILKKVTNTSTGVLISNSYYTYDANGQVMGIYDVNLTSNNATLNELNIYGASRLGVLDRDITLCTAGVEAATPTYPSASPVPHILSYKRYEITNHLGNVNAVISDRKIYVGGTYEAVMVMYSDYYPFGMEMPGRHKDEDKYRFGYNGMEMDNEAKGNGNSYTTEFRQYDPRLGRWLSLDPMMGKYPNMSPYVAFNNNPVYFTDPLGLEGGPPENPSDGQIYTTDDGDQYQYSVNEEGKGSWTGYVGEVEVTAQKPSEASIKIARLKHEQACIEFRKQKEIEYKNSHSMMGQALWAWSAPKNSLTTAPYTPPNARKYADPIDCLLAFEGLSVAGAIATILTIESGGAALEPLLALSSSSTVGVSATTGMLTETSILSTGSIVNIGSGGVGAYLGTSALKFSLDIGAQAVVVGPENVDVADGLTAGLLTPGWSAFAGGVVDYRPFSSKDNFRFVGFNKNLGDAFVDGSLKYTFGARGPVGSYTKQVSDQIVKLGAPQLAPVINAPISLSGKVTSYKAKKLF
jgi:RHS repeat-associated protein